MSTFKERLTAEMQDLKEKIDKLEVFVNSDALFNIDATQQVLLRIQLQSMINYFQILVERIAWLDRN
jgi:predicted CoA-binding protein